MAKRNTTTKAPAPNTTNTLATNAGLLQPAQAGHVWGLLAAGGILPKPPASPAPAALAKAIAALPPPALASARRMLGNAPANHAVTALLVGPATGAASNPKVMAGLLTVQPGQCLNGYFKGLTNAHNNWVLVALVSGNPKRVGTATASRWPKYKFGDTLANNKHMPNTDITWDLAHHLIGLVDPAVMAKQGKAKPATHTSRVGKGKPVTLAGPAPAANTTPAPAPATTGNAS